MNLVEAVDFDDVGILDFAENVGAGGVLSEHV
jgi:hypothetical protein